MNEFKHESSSDDHIVEITDLDPIERSSHLSKMFVALQKRPSLRKRFWRIAITSGTVLLVLLVLFNTFSSVRNLTFSLFSRSAPSQSTALVIKTATPVDSYAFNPQEQTIWALGSSSPFIPSATLSPAPDDCPAISQTHLFEFKGAPRTVGSSPVLIIGFGGPDAVLKNFAHAQPPEIGWYKRIIMLTETNYAGTVTFRGGDMRDGSPIWFGMKQHNQGPITTFTVTPLNSSISNHTGTDEEWGLTSATMYIPRAGCYFLLATWPEGEWIVYFSAGR
ncbi:MAG: hypothetical protein ACXWOL_06360 [Ktedonobacteraceae bacterium]